MNIFVCSNLRNSVIRWAKKKKNPDAKLPEWSKSTAKDEEIETYVLNVFISFYKFSHVINSAHLSGMKK